MNDVQQTQADAIWNRAAESLLDPTVPQRDGDRLLAAAIELDGILANGGVASLDEVAEEDVVRGVAGLRWFGLDAAADVVERYDGAFRAGGSLDELERAEITGNEDYPDDVEAGLEAGLTRALVEHPESFAPLA